MRYSPDVVALSTDLYQLTMAASYDALDMDAEATFSLTVRKLPENRSFLIAAGVEEALQRIAELRFDERALEALAAIPQIRHDALDRLARFRFSGDVWAMPEGTIVFADEPILEVQAPILEAQIVETIVLNALHYPTTVATKAARCVLAAPGKTLVEFGLRRTPGIEAGLDVARACYLAGFVGTSNVLAEREYGIPSSGTVAHSFIEAFDDESEAFRAFARTFPGGATLLIDTYDTVRGARRAAAVAHELAPEGVRIAAVRLDSGDLAALSREVREILDEAGMTDVTIIASGGLDEYSLAELVEQDAPIDAYGVGTRIGTAADAPTLDMVYKLVEYAGRPRLKLSTGKRTLVGPKQVWRRSGPPFGGDVIATRDEPAPADGWTPLLEQRMRRGEIVVSETLDAARERVRSGLAALPPELHALDGRGEYPVRLSTRLERDQAAAEDAVRERERGEGR